MDLKIILFEREKSLFSWIISLVTKCKYTHAAVMFGDTVYDASEERGDVNKVGLLSEWRSRKVLVMNCPDPERKGAEFIRSHIGVDYDWKGVFGYLFNKQRRRDMYCFEFAYYTAQYAGVIDSTPEHNISGRDVLALPLKVEYTGKADAYRRT